MNAQTKVTGVPAVYQAIAAIQGELAKVGIAKNRKNTQGSGYMFRGIDDVYSALAPLLASHGLCIVPRLIEREVIERQSKNGGALFFVTVKADFDFIAVVDGSVHTCTTYGEAMDSGDKATNKAMSAAYKYAAFMAFAIPTEGDNDADATTHEVIRDDAPPAGDEPAPRSKLEGKHASKSALQAAIKEAMSKVKAAQTTRELDAIELEYAEDLKQCERYLPLWWNGDPSKDFAGVKATLAEKRQFLGIIGTMLACDTKMALQGFVKLSGDAIDALNDADRREFERLYEIRETEILTMDRAAA